MLLVTVGCKQAAVSSVPLTPLEVAPEALTFEDTFVGFTSTRTVSISAPAKGAREVQVSTTGPFEATAQLELVPGETAALAVVFRPTAVGAVEGALTLRDVALQQTWVLALSGQGRAVPDCQPRDACVTSRFEVSAGGCVEAPVPDDTPCTSPLSCFARATCVAGECRGTTVRCDDADPCTLDVCSDLGCGQVDGTPYCPGSTNPCLVPSCTRDAGCGLSELPDGTACGARTCTTALICLSGACVQRTPPRTQACADVLVGVPAGRGFVDGRGDDARFRGVVSMAVQGDDLMLVDDARVRHLRHGNVTTVAGRTPSAGIIDGVGAGASIGSWQASLAPTSTPGLFFLGDGTTIRLVTTRGLVTTLAGAPDAGGALDGIGAAARLSLSSPLMQGGAGARWVQVPPDTTRLSPLLVREVSATGEVRTVQSFDLTRLPDIDAGPGEYWFVYSTGVATGDPLTAWVALTDPGRMTHGYRLVWLDGGVVIERAGDTMRWSSASTSVRHDSCRLTFSTDAGSSVVLPQSSCVSSVAFDGDATAYVGTGGSVFEVTEAGDRLIAGPVPDRRIVDGDRDAGRAGWPRSLSLAPQGVYFLDSTASLDRARLLRLPGGGASASLETVDAGVGVQSSLAFHQGQLWLNRNDNVGIVSVFEPSGALVRRFSPSVLNLGQLKSNGSVIRATAFWFHELSVDGGVRRIPLVDNAQSSAPGPTGEWYVFAGRDPLDGGVSQSPRQLFRVEADDSLTLVAGDVTKSVEVDGPALTAGIVTAHKMTVAADGTVFFLGSDNTLRQLRNGQVTTLMTLSDTPLDLVALPDGSLVVSVDAALLRVFP